jgi:hypothetical protein
MTETAHALSFPDPALPDSDPALPLARSPVTSVRRPQISGESPRLGLDRAEALAFLGAAEASGTRGRLPVKKQAEHISDSVTP